MSTVVICGVEYALTNEPIHGVVRALRDRQKAITFDFIFRNKDLFEENPKITIDEAITLVATTRPQAMAEYSNRLEEFDRMGALSLATGHLFTEEEIFQMKEKEFEEACKKCSEAIGGGGMKYFFGDLNKNTLSREKGQTIPKQILKKVLPTAKK